MKLKLYEVTDPSGDVNYLITDMDNCKSRWLGPKTVRFIDGNLDVFLWGKFEHTRRMYPSDTFEHVLTGEFEECAAFVKMSKLLEK